MNRPHPFIYISTKADFLLRWQTWVVAMETTWPAKPKLFTVWLVTDNLPTSVLKIPYEMIAELYQNTFWCSCWHLIIIWLMWTRLSPLSMYLVRPRWRCPRYHPGTVCRCSFTLPLSSAFSWGYLYCTELLYQHFYLIVTTILWDS